MCYKNEKQKDLLLSFEKKSSDLPEFIKNYFVLLSSGTTKINNLGTITSFLNWLTDQKIIEHSASQICPDDLRKVTDIHVVKYLDGLKNGLYGNQIAQSSANTKLNIFRGFWSYLLENDHVSKNIITKKVAEKYKTKDKNVHVPTDKEIEDFLANIENIKNEKASLMYTAIIKLFMGSGIRLDELVGLDMSDLHFDNPNERYITIIGKGEYEYNDPTHVKINRAAKDAIESYLKVRNMNDSISGMQPLFISKNHNRLSGVAIQKIFREYSNDTITPHMLRHWVGTKIYINSKYDINKVQDQLRHKNIQTSMKYYVKDDKEGLKDVLETL